MISQLKFKESTCLAHPTLRSPCPFDCVESFIVSFYLSPLLLSPKSCSNYIFFIIKILFFVISIYLRSVFTFTYPFIFVTYVYILFNLTFNLH